MTPFVTHVSTYRDHMAPRDQRRRSPRGAIDVLPSGARRVRVHAGTDPVTKKKHRLIEVVPAGPDVEARAEAVRARLVQEVAERRNPRTAATIEQLLDRYLEQFDGAASTRTLYRGYVRNHVLPLLGTVKVAQLDPETLDSYYAELRRCRDHCDGSRRTDHRTRRPHDCDDRCGPHRCCPLSASTVRHIHFILSGAFRKAVRWRWIATSPIGQAEPPPASKPNPQPPTAAQAAAIVSAAWEDPDWGALVWTAMTTGARRGELCAVRWSAVVLDEGRETLWLRRAIAKGEDGRPVEGALKTHQQRRIALDQETATVLREHRRRYERQAESLGLTPNPDGFVFGRSPDGADFVLPDSVTQRYERLAKRLGIGTTFHKLRHYSATELIVAGVDLRTVAGRLGHGSGGVTTLRTYTAWVSEADQRAAVGIGAGMPARPVEGEPVMRAPRHPYELVAAAVARRIESGELAAREPIPTAEELAAEHAVSLSTARRAVGVLRATGYIVEGAGRPLVAARAPHAPQQPELEPSPAVSPAPLASAYWTLTARGPDGVRYPPRVVAGSLADLDGFRGHLLGIARIEDPGNTDTGESWIGRYELEVAPVDPASPLAPMTLRW